MSKVDNTIIFPNGTRYIGPAGGDWLDPIYSNIEGWVEINFVQYYVKNNQCLAGEHLGRPKTYWCHLTNQIDLTFEQVNKILKLKAFC